MSVNPYIDSVGNGVYLSIDGLRPGGTGPYGGDEELLDAADKALKRIDANNKMNTNEWANILGASLAAIRD